MRITGKPIYSKVAILARAQEGKEEAKEADKEAEENRV